MDKCCVMSAVFCHPIRRGPFGRPTLHLRMLYHRHKIKHHFQGSDHISEANGRVIEHTKSFAETYSTNIVEGPGHLWNAGLFVDVSWNGGQ